MSTHFMDINYHYSGQPEDFSNTFGFPKQQGTHQLGKDFMISMGDLAQQQVSQIALQAQLEQLQLQQQYYYLQSEHSSNPVTPLYAPTFNPKAQSINENEFTQSVFPNPQFSSAADNTPEDDLFYPTEAASSFFQGFLNVQNEEEEQKQKFESQLTSPPLSHHSGELEIATQTPSVYNLSEYLTPPEPLESMESLERLETDICSSSTAGLKKKPKSLRPVKGTNEKYNSQPGPIRASRPEILYDETTGGEKLEFSYSQKKVVSKFSLRCPTINFYESLKFDDEFLRDNCVYPGAMCSPEEYSGKRGNYERECNIIGWKLAELNPEIRGRRGLIQRAVDSWRNTRKDLKIRSRRVRKEHRMKKKRETASV